jgi:hypothetical protein
VLIDLCLLNTAFDACKLVIDHYIMSPVIIVLSI